MKIRNGFVSNSSSASFVIIMTPDQETEWKDSLNPYELQIFTSDWSRLCKSEENLNGQPVIIYSGATGEYPFYEEVVLERTPEDKELSRDEIGEKYSNDFKHREF